MSRDTSRTSTGRWTTRLGARSNDEMAVAVERDILAARRIETRAPDFRSLLRLCPPPISRGRMTRHEAHRTRRARQDSAGTCGPRTPYEQPDRTKKCLGTLNIGDVSSEPKGERPTERQFPGSGLEAQV
jgi:hypothetical protein